MIDINGVAHIALVTSHWRKSRPFYESFLPFLGMRCVFAGDDGMYFIGGRTAVGISRSTGADDEPFRQGSVGLHHICFRCRNRQDVDAAHAFLLQQNVAIIRAPEEGPWAPGYYSLLFEDPAGIRIELNFVPGQGVLQEGVAFNPASDYR